MTFILRPSARSATIEPILPQPMMPSVLLKSSTPMKRFFSHLPAWVEALASGIWRASAIISEIACSAVVMALPNGVFITTMPRAVAAGMSTLSTPMPARPMTLRFGRRGDELGRDLGRRADGEPVIVGDRGKQRILVLAEIGLVVDIDAAVAEDLHGGFGELVGNENAGSWVSRHRRLRKCASAMGGGKSSCAAISMMRSRIAHRPSRAMG